MTYISPDELALKASRKIMELIRQDFPGGSVQRQAAIQVVVAETITEYVAIINGVYGAYYTPAAIVDPALGTGSFIASAVGNPPPGVTSDPDAADLQRIFCGK